MQEATEGGSFFCYGSLIREERSCLMSIMGPSPRLLNSMDVNKRETGWMGGWMVGG